MTVLVPDRNLLQFETRFEGGHDEDWYFRRLFAFVPVDNPDYALIAATQFVQVADLPLHEDSTVHFVPVPHFILQGEPPTRREGRARIERAVQGISESLGLNLVPQFAGTQAGMGVGCFAGTAVFVPPPNAIARGGLFLDLSDFGLRGLRPALLRIETADPGRVTPAAFYAGQDRVVVTLAPGLPIRFEVTGQELLDHLNGDRAIVLVKGEAGSPAVVRQVPINAEAARVAQGNPSDGTRGQAVSIFDPPGEGGRLPEGGRSRPALLRRLAARVRSLAWQAVPAATFQGERVTVPPLPSVDVHFDPDRASATVALDGLAKPGARNRNVRLVVQPDLAFTRLRHGRGALPGGAFTIRGIVLPQPHAYGGVIETLLHLRADGHLVGHALDQNSVTVILRCRRRLGVLVQNEVVVIESEARETVLPFDPDGGSLAVTQAGLIVRRCDAAKLRGTAGLGQAAMTCLERGFLALSRSDGQPMGYLGCPAPFSRTHGALADDEVAEYPLLLDRRDASHGGASGGRFDPLKHALCLDWLDDAVTILGEAPTAIRGGETKVIRRKCGFAEFLQSERDQPAWAALGRQSLQLRPRTGAVEGLALVTPTTGRGPLVEPLTDGLPLRLGPLLCDYRAPEPETGWS